MRAQTPDFVAVDWHRTIVPAFGSPPYPGAHAVLTAWMERGLPVFVVSRATPAAVQADVQRAGLSLAGSFGCEDKTEVLSALRALHGQGLYLGDTAEDRRAAEEAGIPFWQACLEQQAPLDAGQRCFRSWEQAARLLADHGGEA